MAYEPQMPRDEKSRLPSPSDLVKAVWISARQNPLTASMVAFAVCMGGYSWYAMGRADINLLLNAPFIGIIFVLLFVLVKVVRWGLRFIELITDIFRWVLKHLIQDLRTKNSEADISDSNLEQAEKWLQKLPKIQPKGLLFRRISSDNPFLDSWLPALPLALFATSFVTALFYSPYIAGDWMEGHRFPSACIAGYHLHHWSPALAAFCVLLCIGICREARYRSIGLYAYGVSASLFIALCGVFAVEGPFSPTNSLWKVILIYMTGSFFFGKVLRSNETGSLWFALVFAAALGTTAGMFVDGFRGIITNFPSALIYLDGCVMK